MSAFKEIFFFIRNLELTVISSEVNNITNDCEAFCENPNDTQNIVILKFVKRFGISFLIITDYWHVKHLVNRESMRK